MPTYIPLTKGTCADCGINGFDNTVGCASRDCGGDCVQCRRMASPCRCTCKEMGFASCPLYETKDCPCVDDTTKPGKVLNGAFIGWSDPPGESLSDLARATCPGDGRSFVTLWKSRYDFDIGTTTTNLNCPISTGDWDQLLINDTLDPQEVAAAELVYGATGCAGGALFVSRAQLEVRGGIEDCSQEGGAEAFALQFTDACGNFMMFCPFKGVTGRVYSCEETADCCRWSNTGSAHRPCDGETAEIVLSFDLTGDCQCAVYTTATIQGVDYPLEGVFAVIHHVVSPCSVGQSITVTLSSTYDTCTPSCAPTEATFDVVI